MKNDKYAVLGAGGSGQAMAADLALGGYEVRLYETPKYKSYIDPIIEEGGVVYQGVPSGKGRKGYAEITAVTSDMAEVVDDINVICFCLPAYRHEKVIDLLIPHLEDGQNVVFWPDNWGSLRLQNVLREAGNEVDITIAGAASGLYAGRRVAPNKVWVNRIKVNMRISALLKNRTPNIVHRLSEPWPGRMIPGDNILELILSNAAWYIHPPLMIFNASRIESEKGKFNMAKEGGYAPSLGVRSPTKLMDKLDEEIRAVMAAWGLNTEFPSFYPKGCETARPTEEAKDRFAMQDVPGNLEAGSGMGPITFDHRYLTEEVPYGLVPVHYLGRLLDVTTPHIDATITLSGLLMDIDYWEEGLTSEKLGWGGYTAVQILRTLNL